MIARGSNRALHYAVLASLVLHAAALVVFPDLRPAMTQVVESVPVIARLLDLPPAPVAPPAPETKPETRPEKKLESKPTPAPLAKAQPAPAVSEIPAAPSPQPAPPPPVAAAPQAAPQAAETPKAIEALPAPAGPSAEVRAADQYRLMLIASARRIKERLRYPPQAKENNWEGDVVLGVAISPAGEPAVSVKRGSGYEVLDRQAAEILRLATLEVSLPRALQGKESVLRDLAFEYRLKDN